MRQDLHPGLERCRVVAGSLASEPGSGPQGAFIVPGPLGDRLVIVASDGRDWCEAGLLLPIWEHVSVHVDGKHRVRTPTWAEMDYVKDLFWEEGECVVQYHVPKGDHINQHPHTLHLWRAKEVAFPMPPKECV